MNKKNIFLVLGALVLLIVTPIILCRFWPFWVDKNTVLSLNFDEGRGDKVTDKAQGLSGSVDNPKWVAGRPRFGFCRFCSKLEGSALELDQNSFVKIADNDSFKMDKFEIEAWIKLTSDPSTWPGSYQTILSKEGDFFLRFWHGHDENGRGRGISAIYFGNGINHANAYLPGFNYVDGGYSGHEISDFRLDVGPWYKMTMRYDGSYLTLSINGEIVARTFCQSRPTHSRSDLYIGSHIRGNDGFIGIIDDVKIRRIE